MTGLLANTIDMHIHCGPEAIPRRYDSIELSRVIAASGMAGAVIKSHFVSTSDWAWLAAKYGAGKLYGSVVLNHYVGGINADAIRGSLGVTWEGKQLLKVVWMPTMHAAGHIDMRQRSGAVYDIPEEWTHGVPSSGRRTISSITPISLVHPATRDRLPEVLEVIAENSIVLATGHLSAAEIAILIPMAKSAGVEKIIITHPLYGATALSQSDLKDFCAVDGVFNEQTYGLHTLDEIPLARMMEHIRAAGPAKTVLTSDLGQVSSPPPPEGYAKFLEQLLAEGLTEGEISVMSRDNPAWLLGLTGQVDG